MLNRISLLQKKLRYEPFLMTSRSMRSSYPAVPMPCCRYFSTTASIGAGRGPEESSTTSSVYPEIHKVKHVVKEQQQIDVQHDTTHIQTAESSSHHEKHLHEDDHKHGVDVDVEEMEQEDMFVAPDISLGTDKIEWGGPRRGGRYAEPTRFGDWERKGRCTDF